MILHLVQATSKRIDATAFGACLKTVECEKCKTRFYYVLRR